MKFILNNPTQETQEIISSLENLDELYVYGDFEGLHYNDLPKVDLGLPSGLKWAKCNVGAENETDPGLYFMWGETEGHVKGSRYKFGSTNYTAKGLDAISTDLTLAQDAANVYLGREWRMPTKEEFEELYNNTNVIWTTINGVNGCKFTNKNDDTKYIFMPAAGVYTGALLLTLGSNGRYLSSTFNSSSSAYNFHFNSSSQKIDNVSRSSGYPVRGVYDAPVVDTPDLPEITEEELPNGLINLGLPSGLKWASCNIGANKPCESGLLFQWGRTDGYAYGDTNHRFSLVENPPTTSGKTYAKGEVLVPADDAAYAATNGAMRMPTPEEIDELVSETTNQWCQCKVLGDDHTGHTVYGRLFISKKDESKKIFIPAAGKFDGLTRSFIEAGSNGYVWSSSFDPDLNVSDNLYFESENCLRYYDGRECGLSVRAVCDAPDINVSDLPEGAVDLGLSVKWSSCNIGADKPYKYGKLFQWGRVDGYAYGSPLGTLFEAKDGLISTSSNPPTESGKTYNIGEVLNPADDAAYVATNGLMRMPTSTEIDELISGTTNQWCYCNSVLGKLFTSKTDTSKKIFIPAAGAFDGNDFVLAGYGGCIWSSSLGAFIDPAYGSWICVLGSDNCYNDIAPNYYGVPVRGVCK